MTVYNFDVVWCRHSNKISNFGMVPKKVIEIQYHLQYLNTVYNVAQIFSVAIYSTVKTLQIFVNSCHHI